MENVLSFRMIPVAKGKVIDYDQYKSFFLDEEVLGKILEM